MLDRIRVLDSVSKMSVCHGNDVFSGRNARHLRLDENDNEDGCD